MNSSLFHIATRESWNRASELGSYRPDAFAADGFIHLSEERQWLATANCFYRGRADLVLLELDESKLRAEVRREPADADLFPHLYGELNLDAVIAVHALQLDGTGAVLPLGPKSG
jgi:uncharacterized protein (DUF952 family)